MGCYSRYEEGVSRIFAKYGVFVSKYPWQILILALLTNILLGIGLMRLESEGSTEVLYTPMHSQASKDREKARGLFELNYEENFDPLSQIEISMPVEVIVRTKSGDNILQNMYYDEIKAIDTHVRKNITVQQNVALFGICAKFQGSCVVSGESVTSNQFLDAFNEGRVTFPVYNRRDISENLGNVQYINKILKSATVVRLKYYLLLNNDTAAAWEREFIDQMKNYHSSLLDIAISTSQSLDIELDGNVSGDILWISLTFTIMLTYASLATTGSRINCIADRSNLGRAGVLATVLAILGSFGLTSVTGLKYVALVGVMPFLIVGIGLDDVFILLSGLADAPLRRADGTPTNTQERISFAMATSGVSITITSLTDFLAFGIGSSSSFVAIRNFSIYTGVAVLFCYLNQLTVFVPCMVINEKRAENSLHAYTCLKTKSKDELKNEGRSGVFQVCCAGSPAKNNSEFDNFCQKYPTKFCQFLVGNLVGKVFIALTFVVYLGFSVYGSINLQEGLELKNLVSDKSYLYKFNLWNNLYFDRKSLVTFFYDLPLEYHTQDTQNEISALAQKIKAHAYISSDFERNWLNAYSQSTLFNSSSELAFIGGLKEFLKYRPDLANDIAFDSSGTTIIASRFHFMSKPMFTTTEEGEFMQSMRKLAYESKFSVFAYTPPFIFYEQYVEVFPATMQTLGIAVGVMLVVTTIFMPNVFLVVMVTVTLVIILLGIVGFMYYWNLTLSSITMIDLIMTVGFSVDFSAHICHAYMSVTGKTRGEKVHHALSRSGGPIFNSALSSILGIIVLVFSKSYIFLSFFKLMLIVMLFGLFHALWVLPMFLSLIGPMVNAEVGENIEGNKEPEQSTKDVPLKGLEEGMGNEKDHMENSDALKQTSDTEVSSSKNTDKESENINAKNTEEEVIVDENVTSIKL